MTFRFAAAVPLETMSVEVIDAAGSRTEVKGLRHGATGTTEVIAPLPSQSEGAVSVRWRLVGPDGHPITGRVGFTVAAATAVPANGAGGAAVAQESPTPPADSEAETPFATPALVRFLLRLVSYLAIVVVGGFVAGEWLLPGLWQQQFPRRMSLSAVAIIIVLALAQLMVIASDIEAVPPWQAAGGLAGALKTHAGMAFVVRAVLGAVLALIVVFDDRLMDYAWVAAAAPILGLLATWAYAGHSRSMRWPQVGIPVDVLHHAAAGAWLGGLVTVSQIGLALRRKRVLVDVMQRFSRLAMGAVLVLVATGIVQAIRLTGSPQRAFTNGHGRYLLVKLVVIALMLKIADINRRRVVARFSHPRHVTRSSVFALRRAMAAEFGLGVAVIAVTAAMVVTPPPVAPQLQQPSTANPVAGDPPGTPTSR